MQIGEVKCDIDLFHGKAKNFLGIYTESAITKEGKRLLKKYPNYQYLDEDPWLKTETDFYKSVVYAYMVDQILKEHPEFKNRYDEEIVTQKRTAAWIGLEKFEGKEHLVYSMINGSFLDWYQDYLREQTDPGVLERERQEWNRKQQELKIDQKIRKVHERVQLEQDLASGKRVVCPYCKSTNTEKISTVSRAVSVSLVGAASGKIGKQWHCKQCGSNF